MVFPLVIFLAVVYGWVLGVGAGTITTLILIGLETIFLYSVSGSINVTILIGGVATVGVAALTGWLRDLFLMNRRQSQALAYERIQMAEQIRVREETEAALEELNSDLEARVVQRTDEFQKLNEQLLHEIADREHAEMNLRESEERYALAAKGTNEGLWDWRIDRNIIYYSPRWKSLLGLETNGFGDHIESWYDHIHPADIEDFKRDIDNHLEGLTPHLENEHRLRHIDSSYRWVLCRGLAIQNGDGKPYRMAGSITDITKQKTFEDQILHNALHDPLTGLPNRVLFNDRLGRALERAKRNTGFQFAILFLDLDCFKLVNDSLGHDVGDQLLIKTAKRLKGCVRAGDTVARLGGDEFVMLLEDIQDIRQVTQITERFQKELVQPFHLGEHEVFTTVSIGITMSSVGYDRPDHMLRDADTAMYRAKSLGRARYEVFDQSMHAMVVNHMSMEMDLRRAIERKEFIVHYQPLIDLVNGDIIGFEALVRWNHPERGLILPTEFIPLAEESLLIVSIDMLVLEQACWQTRQWQRDFDTEKPLTISVNFSGKQFAYPDMIQRIDEILDKTGLDPACLALEITESALMQDIKTARRILIELQERGIHLYMDDFGTGYSSLSNLNKFPFSSLKIDRSFVAKINGDQKNLDIVQAIVNVAESMGLGVIAEGVETENQLNSLKSMSCDLGQGYFFSKPLDAEAASEILKEQVIVLV